MPRQKRVVVLVGIAKTSTNEDINFVIARDTTISAVRVLVERLKLNPDSDFVVVPSHTETVPGMPSYKALLSGLAHVVELAPGNPLNSVLYVPFALAS